MSMSPNITRTGFMGGPTRGGIFKGSGAIVLDMSEVVRNMGRLTNQIMPAKIKKGLEKAGVALMVDAITVIDTVPIRRGKDGKPAYPPEEGRKAGELRASGAVFVDGRKINKTSVSYGEGAIGIYQPELYGGTPIPRNSHEACVVFNAPYAATQHETFPDKTEPTAGTDYLGGKLSENAMKYIKIVVDGIKL